MYSKKVSLFKLCSLINRKDELNKKIFCVPPCAMHIPCKVSWKLQRLHSRLQGLPRSLIGNIISFDQYNVRISVSLLFVSSYFHFISGVDFLYITKMCNFKVAILHAFSPRLTIFTWITFKTYFTYPFQDSSQHK